MNRLDSFKPSGEVPKPTPRRIAVLGNALPRQCGIATFSSDLADALRRTDPELQVDCLAMNDRPGYEYPPEVVFQIDERLLEDYEAAANFVNTGEYQVLSVQHEYGIFGGEAGAYLLALLRRVNIPIVTTLHTVLEEPTPAQKTVMDELLQLSERVVVMSRKAIEFLMKVHDVCPNKIDLIHHGVPDTDPDEGRALRARLGIEGPMILTFGLLSPDKGIQYAIEAMRQVLQTHPNAVYYVVGATHPNVKAQAKESYRQSLIQLAESLGIADRVRFVDRFVSPEELWAFLAAMDLYITPYLNPKQITSGTLAYALGTGKAVVSTPYWYAEELLADGRGMLVPFRSADAIAQAMLRIFGDDEARRAMGEKALALSESMRWPEVGRSYLASIARAREGGAERLRQLVLGSKPLPLSLPLPELNLSHLEAMSDETGILQHATYSVPNRNEGYCLDDNARALLLTTLLGSEASPALRLLQSRYFAFVLNAFNPVTQRFRNFMSYDRRWLEEVGSDDSHGRAVWALGALACYGPESGMRDLAAELLHHAAPPLERSTSPRTWAYGLLGLDGYLKIAPQDLKMGALRETLANRLWGAFETEAMRSWPWPESILAYANARLPQALIAVGVSIQNRDMLNAGLKSLAWLMHVQTGPHGVFAPIGCHGFYPRGGERAWFDQQPIEAHASVSACLSAYFASGEAAWLQEANRAFLWFLGDNMSSRSLYDPSTGGCFDGLHATGVNRNQGAESTLSFLGARSELQRLRVKRLAQASRGVY